MMKRCYQKPHFINSWSVLQREIEFDVWLPIDTFEGFQWTWIIVIFILHASNFIILVFIIASKELDFSKEGILR